MPISLFSIILFGSLTLFLALMAVLVFLGKVPLRYNLRNLVVRWPITLLTGMAFILVIGLMTVMLAFVNGLYQLTQGSGQPGNVMVLADGATDELFSNLGASDITQLASRDDIVRDEDGHKLVSWETYVVVNQPIANAVKGGRQRRFLQVRGIQDPVLSGRVHNLPLHEGGAWFSEVQELPDGTQAIQAVLGEGMAREMGKDRNKASLELNDVFELGPRKWVVTGVLKSSGSTFDSEIWAKQSRVGETVGTRSALAPTRRRPHAFGLRFKKA